MKVARQLIAVALSAGMMHGAWAAQPDEEKVLKAIRHTYPGTHFDRVLRTPIQGLYEVWMGQNVAFVSGDNTRYLVFGRMVDATTLKDLTAARMAVARSETAQQEARIDFASLPLKDAIRTTQGSGRRKLAVFSDPRCVYCGRLEEQLVQVRDVTVYNFMVPFQDRRAALDIWCAADPAEAWRMGVAGRGVPSAPVECAHPLDRNLDLARRHGVQATPTLVFADGEIVQGVLNAAEIEERLAHRRRAQNVKE